MEIFGLILGLSVCLSTGFCLFVLLARSDNGVQFPWHFVLATAFLIGAGAISFFMFIWAVLGLPNEYYAALAVNFILCVYVFAKRRSLGKIIAPVSRITRLSLGEIILSIAVVLRLAYAFILTLRIHMWGRDVLSIWGLRAKVFYFSGVMEFFRYPMEEHASYPNFVPTLLYYLYKTMGDFNDCLVKIVFPLFLLSALAISYFLLRRFTSRFYALCGLYILTAMPLLIHHATVAYADLPLMVYHLLAIAMLIVWIDSGKRICLTLATTAMFFTVFIKLEGVLYAAGLSLAVLAYCLAKKDRALKKRISTCLQFSLPAFALAAFQGFFKSAMGLPDYHTSFTFALRNLLRIPAILLVFFKGLFIYSSWNIVWFMFFSALIIFRKQAAKEKLFYFLVVLVLLYIGLYTAYFTFGESFKFLVEGDSVHSRIFLHFAPLAVISAVLLYARGKADLGADLSSDKS